MKFGIEKSATLTMKGGKGQLTEGTGMPNKERIRTLVEKGNYKYLEISEADIIKQAEMKENNEKRAPQKNEKASRNKYLYQKSHQREKHLGNFPL